MDIKNTENEDRILWRIYQIETLIDKRVSILEIVGAKDGGDNWSYKAYKAAVKSSPTTTNISVHFLKLSVVQSGMASKQIFADSVFCVV